ncbi:hypothetical protein [Cloacibacterium sp.]|uniref:hypothetical protein n=1 Tax=Cloacibacterium sp. TaxID=1913682 RepID=UPI0039E6F356
MKSDQFLPSHISMYVSLFQLWSVNGFINPFRICREDIMKLSKIKSFATYHKCIRELQDAGFINYLPNYNSYIGSLIEIKDLDIPRIFQVQSFQNLKSNVINETDFSAPKFYEVELYFKERDLTSNDASLFYSFYESQHWICNNKKLIKCWKAAARNWICKIKNNDDRRD